MQVVIPQAKFAQARAAYGPLYKHNIVWNIVNYLKREYLTVKEKRLPLPQLLKNTFGEEVQISEVIKKWLEEEGLPNHPRIFHNSRTNRYGYKPPLRRCFTKDQLEKILERMHINNEGGLLKQYVWDSMPDAELNIKRLVEEDKITQLKRGDKNHVLFFKPKNPDLDRCQVELPFVRLWRKVGVNNMSMNQINMYLRTQKLPIMRGKGNSYYIEEIKADLLEKEKAEELQQSTSNANDKELTPTPPSQPKSPPPPPLRKRPRKKSTATAAKKKMKRVVMVAPEGLPGIDKAPPAIITTQLRRSSRLSVKHNVHVIDDLYDFQMTF